MHLREEGVKIHRGGDLAEDDGAWSTGSGPWVRRRKALAYASRRPSELKGNDYAKWGPRDIPARGDSVSHGNGQPPTSQEGWRARGPIS